MDALAHIANKYNLDLHQRRMPVEIPNAGREVELPALLHDLGCHVGAEVGVERGEYSETLCRAVPGLMLYCVDAWKVYVGYRDHVDQGKLERFYEQTVTRLRPYQCEVIRKFSQHAALQFEDSSLDFIYLDGNHSLPHVIADLAAWTPKVRAGGIVAGHDYLHHRWPNQMHVPQAIHAWTDAYDIHPWFVLGRKAKIPGEIRDDGRSWFWVHEPRTWRKGMAKPIRQ